jgi:hypothetical protein
VGGTGSRGNLFWRADNIPEEHPKQAKKNKQRVKMCIIMGQISDKINSPKGKIYYFAGVFPSIFSF